MAEILKRQRGNQYGFGDDPNSDELVTRNLTDSLLDNTDITTTKPIENFFGNLDRELKKTGSKGFGKVGDDLIIKYSKDLLKSNAFEWRTKATREKAKQLKTLEKSFKHAQRRLICSSVDEEEASILCSNNKILQCINACKQKHNGPLTTTEELNNLVNNWEVSEKLLHTSLNLEIRLRKLTYTNIKTTCPLFKQKGLTIKQKVRNLQSLIETQLDMKTLADMDDLEAAIREEPATTPDSEQNPTLISDDDGDDDEMVCDKNTEFKKEEFIIGLFTTGIYPGEIVAIDDDYITADFFVPANLQGEDDKRFWKRSSEDQNEKYTIHQSSILPVRPVLDVSKYSTNRNIVFELLNADIISKFI